MQRVDSPVRIVIRLRCNKDAERGIMGLLDGTKGNIKHDRDAVFLVNDGR